MTDRKGRIVNVGDIVRVEGYHNPNKYDVGIWEVVKIDLTIGNIEAVKVEGISSYINSEHIELVAKKIEE